MSGIELGGAEAFLHQAGLFSVPHDPASVVVYILLAISGFAIWYGDHRSKKGSRDRTTGEGG